MSRIMCAIAFVVLVALSLPVSTLAEPPTRRPLKEEDVLKLIELQVEDGCIVSRIQQGGGPAFTLDAAAEERLRKAGASDEVIAALRGQAAQPADLPDDPARQTFAVWVKQQYSQDCPLASELRVNGNLIDDFTSTAQRPCGKHLKMGWNTITMKTRARDGLKEWNYLRFDIGPTHKDPESGKTVMEPALWSFTNRTDWQEKGKAIRHKSGPDVKEVTLTFRVYFAGLKHESREVKNGDYVLSHKQAYYDNPPVTSTVFVNGTPLTTFLGQHRNQRVVTPLLHKGKNEVRVVAQRVTNTLENNAVTFHLEGPAEYSASRASFEAKQVLNFRSTDGWVQDKKSGQWRVEKNPQAESLEKTLTFQLDEGPKRKEG